MTYVKHDQFIGRSLGAYGEWAQIEIDVLLRYVAVDDFVIDVGANIGFHTLSFARKVGKAGVIWAFEPDPVNGLLLRHNIIQAGLDDVVIPFDLALSDALGVCSFRTHPISSPENFGHTGIAAGEGDYPRVSIPLDALMLDRAPALIKIDVEGHELPALDGMIEIIERYRPVLSIEADTPEEIEANGAFASALGYDVYSLVVNAYNPHNFAENETDIWKGHGRCANLLCVVPDKHRAPDDLELLRHANVERSAISRIGKSVGAAYSASALGGGASGEGSIQTALGMTQADIKRSVSGFLKTTYGKLDPVTDAALVNGALDLLAANGPSAEGIALQRLIVAAVESFADSLGSRRIAVELAEARAERGLLREETLALHANIDQLTEERRVLETQHQLAIQDMTSRLGAASAAEVRLAAELAQQGEMARREVSTALAKVAEAEARNTELAIAHAALQDELAGLNVERDRLADESSKLIAKLQAANEDMTSRLGAASAAEVRLTEELAQQGEMARREVSTALAKVAEAEARNTELAIAHTALQDELAGLNVERDRLADESSKLTAELQAANKAVGQHAQEVANLRNSKVDVADALTQIEHERDRLVSELSEAQGRLALQAQQLRHFRATKG